MLGRSQKIECRDFSMLGQALISISCLLEDIVRVKKTKNRYAYGSLFVPCARLVLVDDLSAFEVFQLTKMVEWNNKKTQIEG